MSSASEWDRTHLCTKYNEKDCEFFLRSGGEKTVVKGKQLDIWCYYCTSENKIRKIGSGGTWTGLSPKFCPKRNNGEGETYNIKPNPSYKDILLEHYPNFDESRLEDFEVEECVSIFFDDDCGNNCISPSKNCCECWESECKYQWKLTREGEEDIEEYLIDTQPSVPDDTQESTQKNEKTEVTKMANFNIGAFISQQEQLKQIDLELLVPYHNHKFNLYTGERLDDMVNSIKENGVLTPIIVRPAPDGGGKYEILAGHNRCNAAKMAGLKTVPGIVKEQLTDDEAEMYVIETNTMQRGFGDLAISEQAAVIAMWHSSMFSTEKREEILKELSGMNCNVNENSEEKKSKLALSGEEYGLSKNSVARLIRINALLESCDKYTMSVNSKNLSVRAAVELSYIHKTALEAIFEKYKTSIVIDNKWEDIVSIGMSTAAELREMFTAFRGSGEQAERVLENMNGKAARAISDKPIKISIPQDTFRKYFTEETKAEEAAEIIDKALEMYFAEISRD